MDLFGTLSSAEFFRTYWQKKPFVFQKAIPGFVSPIDADELAGLACEEDIESRLILEKGGEKPWQVISGPLSEETLTTLAESHWSLSVQGVDRILPEVAALLRHFRFLPNWLLDDILVSYAPDSGSVGAHIDNYDVFILQGQGKRRWLLGGAPQWNEEYREGLDIRLLKKFEPEHDWVLETGDVLYIPMRFAHHGIAIGECLNYSVGFRAPTDGELVRSLATWAIENDIEESFFRDPTLRKQESPGEIRPESLSAIKNHMKSFIDSSHFHQWFGQHITEPKTFYAPLAEESRLSGLQIRECLTRGDVLIPAEGLKCCWVNSNPPDLFIESEHIQLPEGTRPEFLQLLCDFSSISIEQFLHSCDGSEDLWQLISHLHNRGYFSVQAGS